MQPAFPARVRANSAVELPEFIRATSPKNVFSALEIFLSMRYINLHFTYLPNSILAPTI